MDDQRPWHFQDLTVLERHHQSVPGDPRAERGLAPPRSLLRWLVTGFTHPKNGKFGEGDVGRFRKELAEKNPERVGEALALLVDGKVLPDRAWYVLEGYTSPDVLLVTPDALIVVEGKRTEPGPTTSTTWMAGRHQMIRHVDAAWDIRGARSVYGLFVVEAEPGTVEVPAVWRAAATDSRGAVAVANSLPHRSVDDREGISRATVGVTTWQRVVSAFGLPAALLA